MIEYVEKIVNVTDDDYGHAIISDDLWKSWDVDGDDVLNNDEFQDVLRRFANGTIVADPVLVYQPIDLKYLSNFETKRRGGECENFIVIRSNSYLLPISSSSWNEYYAALRARGAFESTRALELFVRGTNGHRRRRQLVVDGGCATFSSGGDG